MNIHKGTLAGLVMAVIMAALLINNAFNIKDFTKDLGCITDTECELTREY